MIRVISHDSHPLDAARFRNPTGNLPGDAAEAHLDAAPASNGAATSSLPSHAHFEGDEDVATPIDASFRLEA